MKTKKKRFEQRIFPSHELLSGYVAYFVNTKDNSDSGSMLKCELIVYIYIYIYGIVSFCDTLSCFDHIEQLVITDLDFEYKMYSIWLATYLVYYC